MAASGHKLFRRCCLTPILRLLIGLMVAGFAPPAQAATSSSVAYVTDFGTGSNDTSGPGSGSSIFVNALTGSAPSGSYTTADGTLMVTVTNVSVSSIDSGGVATLAGFDTVILYQICDIASHPATIAAVNAYLTAGSGKVLIFDADRCAPIAAGPADYTTFLFPFAASTPGPLGAGGSYTLVVPSSLTTGLVVGPVASDAVGDANNFTTFNPNWCGSITATNMATPPNTGFVEAYARTPNGGLVVYEGEDFWFTFGPTAHLRLVFDLMLEQKFNPDGLPCALPASLISLAPATQTLCTGASATVTAQVVDANNVGQAGVSVTFTLVSGPAITPISPATAVTDSSGFASFTFTSAAFGTDVLHASFEDILGNTHLSKDVDVIWNTPAQAVCTNQTVAADATCRGSASVNGGSSDPDGDSVSVSQSPPGPYGLGATGVTLTASDGVCLPSTCSATVTVVDKTAPTVSCVQSVNPSGQNIPAAGNNPKSGQNPDGFYQVNTSDNCSSSSPVTITIGGIPLANGETIKITQTPGKSGVTLVNTMGQPAIKHFQVGPGDAVITATDGSGNTASVTCLVPPPPK